MPAEELYIKRQNPIEKVDLVIDGIGENSNIQDLEVKALSIKSHC
ncbi:hypothetical protein VQL36_14985 [Chengkuizengella sp. SCS-71B]